MLSLARFCEASENVARSEFDAFARPALDEHPEVQDLGWKPLVLDVERVEFEARARSDGLSGFQISEDAAA